MKLCENCPVGVEFFQADGHTDVTKLIDASHSFVNVPEKA